MNTTFASSDALEQELGVVLRHLLNSVSWLKAKVMPANWPGHPSATFDLLATLGLPQGGHAALCVECKREVRPSTLPMLLNRKFPPLGNFDAIVPTLAVSHMTARVANLCVEHGWSWFDLAGNCHIDVPGLLHLRHSGNPPVQKPSRPTANLGTPEACRVVRALLTPLYADWKWTQRSLEMHVKDPTTPPVSLGLVNKVVKHLRNEAFVEALPEGKFKLSDPTGLLHAWRDAYRFDRHERRAYFTLLQGKQLREALARLNAYAGGFAAYAAFSAGEILAPSVRQPKTWLYVARHELKRFEEFTQAKQVDSGENLILLVPDDHGVFFHGYAQEMQNQPLACTNPVQTYVDLWHCGGRGQEAAEAVLEQRLKPVWRDAGLKV